MDSSSSDKDLLILTGKEDRYGGFIVNSADFPADPSHFIQRLRVSMDHWRAKSFKGIWLKLPIKNSNLVQPAVEEGFVYHHAEPDYIMLTYWIPESPSTLPPNASHQVGVAAIVINDKNEILVVQELTGPTRDAGFWKVPSNMIHMGEDIMAGIMRGVKEETSVQTKFVEVLGFRQAHDVAFGKSDLLFLCLLEASSPDIVVKETAIAAAKWMHLDDFKHQSSLIKSEMITRFADIAIAHLKKKYIGFGATCLSHSRRKPGTFFYHNIHDINEFLDSEPNI